jgi:regulator of RNase E activity RraA
MDNQQLNDIFSELTTPHLADAIVRLGLDLRLTPHGISSLVSGTHIAGNIIPVKHFGSVDVFFEAMTMTDPGDILVVDNQGRNDEGCIGDLTAIEARDYGISGMIVWGCHRDTKELIELSFPVFSYGSCPFGPIRVDHGESFAVVHFGEFSIERGDIVFADDDGVIFAPGREIKDLIRTAREIRDHERDQVREIKRGNTLHKQFRFDEYLAKRKAEPKYTFRTHLKRIGGAIEE